MMEKTLQWARDALDAGGQLLRAELSGREADSWVGATIDSRTNCTRRLFFAMSGEKTDGHEFVADAVAAGSGAVVIERDDQRSDLDASGTPYFLVRSTLESLQHLSRVYRDTLDIRVVAVTGSMGKTTTKEYIKSILKKKYRVHSNPGNFNNHIGVPLTLLDTDHDNEYLICEVAANHTGEIDFLSRLLRPDVGVITNIGDAHIGYFGSRDNIASAKSELFVGIDSQGCAVLPSDDAYINLLRERAGCRVVTFGRADGSTYAIEMLEENGDSLAFEINGEPLRIKSLGSYNVLNASAAYAVGELCGVELDRIREALSETEPIPGRSKIYRGRGMVLIDDSYNANPTSMRAALEVLGRISLGRRIAVLGDMAELGEFSNEAHRDLGAHLAGVPVDMIYWLGANGEIVKEGIAGKKPIKTFERMDALADEIESELEAGDVILVKASRSCHLDKVVDRLLENVLEEEG